MLVRSGWRSDFSDKRLRFKKTGAVDTIKDKGTLVVGTSADYAPFEFPIVKDGKKEIVGYDMMVAQKSQTTWGLS